MWKRKVGIKPVGHNDTVLKQWDITGAFIVRRFSITDMHINRQITVIIQQDIQPDGFFIGYIFDLVEQALA